VSSSWDEQADRLAIPLVDEARRRGVPNWFMQIFSTGSLRAGVSAWGAIQVPAAAARVSFIDARDIAEVAAQALREPKHGGKAYTLTGGRALDHSDVAEAISRAAGRPVRYVELVLSSAGARARCR
jgi:uncharacterized protein YbjT (DUF2867 family)